MAFIGTARRRRGSLRQSEGVFSPILGHVASVRFLTPASDRVGQFVEPVANVDFDPRVIGVLEAADLCAGVIKRELDKHEAGHFELPISELDQNFYRMGSRDRDYALSVLDHQSVKYGV